MLSKPKLRDQIKGPRCGLCGGIQTYKGYKSIGMTTTEGGDYTTMVEVTFSCPCGRTTSKITSTLKELLQ